MLYSKKIMTKRIFHGLLLLLCVLGYTSCENYETYGDKKEKEQDAISRFIGQRGIQVISEEQFVAQGETTDTAQNQFVRLSRTGVYMQIVRKGCGDKLEESKRVNLLCRFMEQNILTDSILIRNDITSTVYVSSLGQNIDVSQYVDKLSVYRTGTTITATFVSGIMSIFHGSSVPAGWLVPLNYVHVGRPETVDDEVSMVRLIVPHSQGTADASSTVYPCFYEITYEREK